MKRTTVSGVMLTLMLMGVTVTFNIHPAMGSGTIYIRADGSIDPPTTPISSIDDITYTFGDNIYESIVVERNNIAIDGNGYTLQGTGTDTSCGIDLFERMYVTVRNIQIINFGIGIGLWDSSSSNNVIGNTITANIRHGISMSFSSRNTISGNTITANNEAGIYLAYASYNSISGNEIANNGWGILLEYDASYNSISGNKIANNGWGILVGEFSVSSRIYHNNFINNNIQAAGVPSANIWDDGYPSGGNHWSEYTVRYPDAHELDDSGIWDMPYVIGRNNIDNYPLMNPWPPPPVPAIVNIDPDTLDLKSESKWITAYIELSEGYNPAHINASTVLLNGTIAPILDPKYDFVTNSSEYLVDDNNDGILERMIKFDRAAVESFITSQRNIYGNATLTITGGLLDRTQFEGSDTIRVSNGRPGGRRR